MKKIIFVISLIGTLLLTNVCLAANVSVGTSGTPENIEVIRIYVDPYGVPIEDVEKESAEREAIDRFTSEKIYASEEERIMDQLRQNYDIEEIHKDGKNYWKCTPKNPKTIQVKKSRETVKETEHEVIHSTEYYLEEQPNPNYLEPEELEKRVVWFQVNKIVEQNDNALDLDGIDDTPGLLDKATDLLKGLF